MTKVTCPCCKGEKRLEVHEWFEGHWLISYPPCCHCQGRGWMPAEKVADEL